MKKINFIQPEEKGVRVKERKVKGLKVKGLKVKGVKVKGLKVNKIKTFYSTFRKKNSSFCSTFSKSGLYK